LTALQPRGELDMNLEALCTAWAPRLLSVLRIVTALLFMTHGIAKHLKYPPLPAFAKVELFSLIGFAGLLELVGGALLILGLFTRPVAFILSGEMAVAYWMAHGPRNFHPLVNGGEAAILFCFIFLYIAAAGPGPWSIDAARKK
jgi:putative oxidoreductase